MQTQSQESSRAVPTLFTRNATGLVRELSGFDAFNLVFSAVLIPVGITQVMGFAPQFWPHANMFVSFLIATPLVAFFGLVYLYFTALMPARAVITCGCRARSAPSSASWSTCR